METKVCLTCEEDKPLSEFHTNGWNGGNRDGKRKYHAHCKTCMAAQVIAIHVSRIEEAVGSEIKCSQCGYDKHYSAIDFHHTDPALKETQVSTLSGCSYARIKEEVDKCVMLCANCHRLVHSGVIKIE